MDLVFTTHAMTRMASRGLSKNDVFFCLRYPDKMLKRHGKRFYRKKVREGCVEVCCELKDTLLYVITVYWV